MANKQTDGCKNGLDLKKDELTLKSILNLKLLYRIRSLSEEKRKKLSFFPSFFLSLITNCDSLLPLSSCRGSFSEVYMVREKNTGKLYALKCLKRKHLAHSNLENEIRVLKRSVMKTHLSQLVNGSFLNVSSVIWSAKVHITNLKKNK